MNRPPPSPRSRLTLALCTVLHAFTHAYGTMLVPLYLLIVADLKLGGVKEASLIVTVYGLVYCLGSYAAGVLADRVDRRALLGVGLLGNAAAILLMGLTRRYDVLLALGVAAGVAGTLFHPAANALAPDHFPKNPGLAIGILGMGSGLGFFAGPQYAGWRAEAAGWHLGRVADWQRPCVELGAAGLVAGIAFLLVAREARGKHAPSSAAGDGDGDAAGRDDRYASLPIDSSNPLGPALRNRVLLMATVLGCRDFAGVAGLSLASIYLQKAQGLSAKHAGLTVGGMMLLSTFVNPVAVYFSPARRRLPVLAAILVIGGVIAAAIPFVSAAHTLAVFCGFQTCQMGSYALSDAATLERVAPAVRGRVVGLFLTVAGTFASTGPWVMGWWTDRLGTRAGDQLAYAPLFATLGAMMVAAAFSTPIIARLGRADRGGRAGIDPLAEVMPATLTPVG